MLISVKHRFLFVANTKAASTSIEAGLARHAEIARPGGPEDKHLPLSRIRTEYGFLFDVPGLSFDSFFRFGVMRDPVDWILSWYRFRKGNKVAAPLPDSMSFAEFWRAGDWNIRMQSGAPYDQSRMFVDPHGALLADMILPYERLQADLPLVLTLLDVPPQLPRMNVSTIPPDQAAVPADLAQEVRAHFAADYALWARLPEINAAGLSRLRARGTKPA